MIKRVLLFVPILVWMLPSLSYAQFITIDYKQHNVGEIRQVIHNLGKLNRAGSGFPGLINAEYPPGSNTEHLLATGWYISAITEDGDTLSSNTNMFQNSDQFIGYSNEPWDTVWVIERGNTMEIPYIDGVYEPVADQDFVTRYNDYNEASITQSNNTPLYVDAIQRSYAWASPPLDEMIIYTYEIIPTRHNLEEVYIGFNSDLGLGRHRPGFAFAEDDLIRYYRDEQMVIGEDDGDEARVGLKVLPADPEDPSRHWNPDGHDFREDLTWTWLWSGRFPVVFPSTDPERWRQMTSGQTMQNPVNPGHYHYTHTFGPYTLNVGDTLRWRVAQLHGESVDRIFENAVMVDTLVARDFKVPGPPPVPNATVISDNRRVQIVWEDNAEDYEDPNRADEEESPFMGYRVWKSTVSADGPWTLLADYDVERTGLRHEFEDLGLMNNMQYYYAVQAYSKPDNVLGFPSQFTSRTANVLGATPGTAPPDHVQDVAVVPNPYRGDANYQDYNPPWEGPPPGRDRWLEQDRRIQFINLPARSEINIYTLSGRHVRTLQHEDTERGFTTWDLTSRVGQAVSSGIYMFTARNLDTGETNTGKFVIIK